MAESSKVVHANGSATVTTTVSSNHATAADPSSKMEFTYFAINRGGRGLGIKCCLFKAGLAFDDVQLTFEEFGKAKKGRQICMRSAPVEAAQWEGVHSKFCDFTVCREAGRFVPRRS